jgi:tripartite-type tricarboxylate transporter receptor subunit TctC
LARCLGPKGTPAAIVDRLNREINAGLADTKVRTRFEELGANVIPGTAAQFGKFCADEVAKWARVIKSAGIKAE